MFQVSTALRADGLTRAADDWTPLFNGKDFSGWYTYLDGQGRNEDRAKVFQIRDGAVHVYRDHVDGLPAPKGYFATEAEYSHYHLRFKYKWGEKRYPPRYESLRDAGVLYHMFGTDQVWPRSIECQIQEGDTGDCFTVLGTRVTTTIAPGSTSSNLFAFQSVANGGIEQAVGNARGVRVIKEATFEKEGWNSVELIVRGSEEVVHIVNGQIVFRATDLRKLDRNRTSWLELGEGRIAFQAECAEVYYKDIEIRPLETEGPGQPTAERVRATPVVAVSKKTAEQQATLRSLHVPENFEIEQVAAAPLVDYPMLACFDDEGRLYVSEGANNNDPYEELSKNLPRSIRRLEDTDGDGIFDRSTVFADDMTFPYGGVWHNGALYVASDPSIWRLEDTDGDGVAERRDEFLGRFASAGHASCMKGAYLGPDGMFYFAGGNEGGYDLSAKDGTRLQENRTAPCVFRIHPDGTKLEYFANGAAGIYDLCFDPSGDMFGVTTILKYPRGDGLMHWLYGGAFESSRGISRHARLTGEKLPALKEWAQTSPSGAVRYESGALGGQFRGNIFTAQFNTHQVTRSVVERDGGTWKCVHEEPFVASDDLNCRFTDVLEDADGSLLVINTGGWFRIGCPTAEVAEGDLKGAIYRIRKKGQANVEDARGKQIDWQGLSSAELVGLLTDPRPMVRERAIVGLSSRGTQSVAALQEVLLTGNAMARCNAIWALTRIQGEAARSAVHVAIGDEDPTVAMAALHSAGLHRDTTASKPVVKALSSPREEVRRAAATALGRIGNREAVGALLAALDNPADRFTEHAVIYALMEINAPKETSAGLTAKNPRTMRAALLALDEMPGDHFRQEQVGGLLTSDDHELLKTAVQVLSRHKWTKGIVTFLDRMMNEDELTPEQLELVGKAFRSTIEDRSVQLLVAKRLSEPRPRLALKKSLVGWIGKSTLKSLPHVWEKSLRDLLTVEDPQLRLLTIETMGGKNLRRFESDLTQLVEDDSQFTEMRIAAAILLADDRTKPPKDAVFRLLASACRDEKTNPVTRMTIARTLGNASLSGAQLQQLAELVATSGPLELPMLLRAYEESPAPSAGVELCNALIESPGAINLSTLRLRKLLERYPEDVHVLAAPLLKKIAAEASDHTTRIEELKQTLTGGDPDRGRQLFFGKAVCVQCHRIGRQGSGVGPDLSQIGSIRTRRDLLEAIVAPSATLARGYESVTVVASGKPISGIVRNETATAVHVLTADRSETIIPREEIDEIVPNRLSIMPQGLDRNLTEEELQDLLAFLSSLGSSASADSK